MADMNVQSDSVDVEQIMRQIRSRIREKRGADYTESELQQLASVKLERFLDPKGVRSDLVEQYRRNRVVSPSPPNFEFGEATLFETHRGALRSLRQLLRPLLKLFFNPDKITSALHIQSAVNAQAEVRLRRLEEREPLSYELLHNLTLELTRLGIEVQNLRMRLESLSSRLDFDERRARSLEGVVQYRPNALQKAGSEASRPAGPATGRDAVRDQSARPQPADGASVGESGEKRRRRRRRRRRPGQTMAEGQTDLQNGAGGEDGTTADLRDDAPIDDGMDEDGPDDTDADDQ